MIVRVAAALAVFVVAGTLAVLGADRGRRGWLIVGKPFATGSLLFVVGLPTTTFSTLVLVGLACSLVGDVLLLGKSELAFGAGMVVFLGAHGCYVAAFRSVAGPAGAVLLAAPFVVASVVLLVALWGRIRASWLRVGVAIYTAALTATVLAAFGTRGGTLPGAFDLLLAAGGTLFYVGDASLAWHQFRAPIRHAPYLTLGVYWLGQAAFAIAGGLA